MTQRQKPHPAPTRRPRKGNKRRRPSRRRVAAALLANAVDVICRRSPGRLARPRLHAAILRAGATGAGGSARPFALRSKRQRHRVGRDRILRIPRSHGAALRACSDACRARLAHCRIRWRLANLSAAAGLNRGNRTGVRPRACAARLRMDRHRRGNGDGYKSTFYHIAAVNAPRPQRLPPEGSCPKRPR